ncbi:hypothetical protein BV20DRAFT_418336 [Pilatotrama ljubarskyi]|nr:hypothetical protein BV20DRAFT_418336 [Pilatotrama ljubarskyi]
MHEGRGETTRPSKCGETIRFSSLGIHTSASARAACCRGVHGPTAACTYYARGLSVLRLSELLSRNPDGWSPIRARGSRSKANEDHIYKSTRWLGCGDVPPSLCPYSPRQPDSAVMVSSSPTADSLDPEDVELERATDSWTEGECRVAPAPFNKTVADVTLMSCDHVEFRVRGSILREASPVFDTKLTSGEYGYRREAIEVEEDCKILETLLRICYPIVKPSLDLSLPELESALRAAQKYMMELPVAVLAAELLSRALRSPLAVWAIACRTGLENVARHAVELVSATPATLDAEPVEDLRGVTAGHYFRLREFLRLRGQVPDDFPLLTPAANIEVQDDVQPTLDSAPFPRLQFCDLKCRASDGVELEVHRGALSAASPILAGKVEALYSCAEDGGAEAGGAEAEWGYVSTIELFCWPGKL